MSSTRIKYDKKCYAQQVDRDNNIHDYLLNKPDNNCSTCYQANPEIRAPINDKLKNIPIENDLFGIDDKEECDNKHSCDGNTCKTQIFEELTKDDVKECNIETINTRSEPLHLINVKEATIDRFDWLHYSPQQHTINNDTHLKYTSSRLDIKNNYKPLDQTPPQNADNKLQTTKEKKQTYKAVELPDQNSNPDVFVSSDVFAYFS